MPYLHGRHYDKQELQKKVGDLSQVCGVRPVEFVDGNERGVRAMEIKTGSGLDYTILTDRAMDIFEAKFNGASLCWHSPSGPVAPAFYDPYELGWLWSMSGGLMMTCGLTHVGPPEQYDDEDLGLHGRVANIPAKSVSCGCDWENDEYIIWAMGQVRQARLFGPNLLLNRMIYSRMGQSKIWIKDTIENTGFTETPLMILYHCNIGFPILDKESELLAVVNNLSPRDKVAEKGVEEFDKFEEPVENVEEQCFYIDPDTDEDDMVNVALVNRQFNNNQGIGIYLSYPKSELGEFTEWKMMGEGSYVLGLEPGNCRPEGRNNAEKRGALKTLKPGETCSFRLEMGVLASNNEIRQFEAKLRSTDQFV
jgi:hypothetical protein